MITIETELACFLISKGATLKAAQEDCLSPAGTNVVFWPSPRECRVRRVPIEIEFHDSFPPPTCVPLIDDHSDMCSDETALSLHPRKNFKIVTQSGLLFPSPDGV